MVEKCLVNIKQSHNTERETDLGGEGDKTKLFDFGFERGQIEEFWKSRGRQSVL